MTTDSYVLRTGQKLDLNYFKISHLFRKEQTLESFIKRLAAACESTIHHKAQQMVTEAKNEYEKVLNNFK